MVLGKRPSSSRPPSPLSPSKRVLSLTSTKPAFSSPAKHAKSTSMKCTSSAKENHRVQDDFQGQAPPDVLEAMDAEHGLENLETDVQMDEMDIAELPVSPEHDPLFDVLPPASPTVEADSSRAVPNIYAHASLLLSTSSSLSASLPLEGRADQRETLLAFLGRRFPSVYAPASSTSAPSTPSRPGPASMYVSGPPGIGKTALLSSVLGEFEKMVEEGKLAGEVVLHMENCASVASGGGEGAWERLARGLGMDVEEKGRMKGREVFEEGLKDGRRYLLILDEIDHLIAASPASSRASSSSAPDLLNSLFSLASTPASPLTLIGIANDLTLKALSLTPASTPTKSAGKGKGKPDPLHTPAKPIRLHFKPYTWQELVSIVSQRLSHLAPSYPYLPCTTLGTPPCTPPTPSPTNGGGKPNYPLISTPVLERLCKKVASTTGDVRTILSLVRSTISFSTPSSSNLSSLNPTSAPKATMPHLSKALTAASYAGSGLAPTTTLSKRLEALQSGPHHRLALCAVVIAISRGLAQGLDESSTSVSITAAAAAAVGGRVTVEEAFKLYRDVVVASAEALAATRLDATGFAETVGMVEDLCGAIVVRGRPGGTTTTSPTKKSPSRVKRGEKGKLVVELGTSITFSELVKSLSEVPKEGKEREEDESTRLVRRCLEKERMDSRWRLKRREMGRDEERRAEEELEGREWERRVLGSEMDGGKA
ncbi:hypothetical protein JCM11641_006477 [Rhodosporidiobolus odoratus]